MVQKKIFLNEHFKFPDLLNLILAVMKKKASFITEPKWDNKMSNYCTNYFSDHFNFLTLA